MTVCDRPVTRATLSKYRGRPLVVTLHPTFVTIRQKGRRHSMNLDYQAIYDCAAKAEKEKKKR